MQHDERYNNAERKMFAINLAIVKNMENLSAPPSYITFEGYIPSINVFTPDDTKILTHKGLYDLTQKKLLWEKDLRLAELSKDGNRFVMLRITANWKFARPRLIQYGDASNGNILFEKDERYGFARTNVAMKTTQRGATIIVAKINNENLRAWKVTPTGGIQTMGRTKYTRFHSPISRVDISPDGKDVVLAERFYIKLWNLQNKNYRFTRLFDFNTIIAPDRYKVEIDENGTKALAMGIEMYLPVVLCASYNKTGDQIALGSGIYYKNMSHEVINYDHWRRGDGKEVKKVKTGKVRIIDSVTGADVKVFTLARDYDCVNSVCFSPNGSQVVCSACNFNSSYSYMSGFDSMQTIMVFDVKTGACLLHRPFDFRNLRAGDFKVTDIPLNVAYANNGYQIAFGNRLLDIRYTANKIQSIIREFPVIATVLDKKELEVEVFKQQNLIQLEVGAVVDNIKHPLIIVIRVWKIIGPVNLEFTFKPSFLGDRINKAVLNDIQNSEITDLHEACIRLFNAYDGSPSTTSGPSTSVKLRLKF